MPFHLTVPYATNALLCCRWHEDINHTSPGQCRSSAPSKETSHWVSRVRKKVHSMVRERIPSMWRIFLAWSRDNINFKRSTEDTLCWYFTSPLTHLCRGEQNFAATVHHVWLFSLLISFHLNYIAYCRLTEILCPPLLNNRISLRASIRSWHTVSLLIPFSHVSRVSNPIICRME